MNFHDAINHHQFALSEREMAIARQFYDSGREHAGLPDAIDLAAVCRKSQSQENRIAELAAELAKAERRYASLIPLLVHTEDEAVSSCLNWQAEEMGIGSWREHFGKPMAEALGSGAKLQNDKTVPTEGGEKTL